MKIKYKSLYGYLLSNAQSEPTFFHQYQSAKAFGEACGLDTDDIAIFFPSEGEIDESDILDTPEKAWEKQTREEILNESYRVFKTFNK